MQALSYEPLVAMISDSKVSGTSQGERNQNPEKRGPRAQAPTPNVSCGGGMKYGWAELSSCSRWEGDLCKQHSAARVLSDPTT